MEEHTGQADSKSAVDQQTPVKRASIVQRRSSKTGKPCALSDCSVARVPGRPYCVTHCDGTAREGVYGFRVFAMTGKDLIEQCETYITCNVTGVGLVVEEQDGKEKGEVAPQGAEPVWLDGYTFPAVPLANQKFELHVNVFKVEGDQFLGRLVLGDHILKATAMDFESPSIPTKKMTPKEKKKALRHTLKSTLKNKPQFKGIRSKWAALVSRPTADGTADEPAMEQLGYIHYILAPVGTQLQHLSRSQMKPDFRVEEELSMSRMSSAKSRMSRADAHSRSDFNADVDVVKISVATMGAATKLKMRSQEKTYSKEKLQKLSAHREQVRLEIISTEENYVKTLTTIKEKFVVPLKAQALTMKLKGEILNLLVCNIEQLQGFHTSFLDDLKAGTAIAQPFLKIVQFLQMYVTFLNGYPLMLDTHTSLRKNKKFQEFMAKQATELGAMDLMSYMIQPVQRVPRYVLLLAELKKRTLVSHDEYDVLEEALQQVQAVALKINEGKRAAEDMSKLLAIQNQITGECPTLIVPSRKLIREGEYKTIQKKGIFGSMKVRVRRFFTFNDMLLWTTTSYAFKGVMNLSSVVVEEQGLSLLLHNSQTKITMMFETKEDRMAYMKIVETLVTKLKETRKQQRTTKRTMRKKACEHKDNTMVHSQLTKALHDFTTEGGGVVGSTLLDDVELQVEDAAEKIAAVAVAPKPAYAVRKVMSRRMRSVAAPPGGPLAASVPAPE